MKSDLNTQQELLIVADKHQLQMERMAVIMDEVPENERILFLASLVHYTLVEQKTPVELFDRFLNMLLKMVPISDAAQAALREHFAKA